MSKKRSSAAFESDDQTNGDSGASVLQREDNAKHAKLTSLSDTTLQDLPIEMLERILVQAVVMEVKDMKMAKSVWKDKAGLVISRLITVCSQWSSILTTDFFRKELNRVIDGTDQEVCRLEILHQYPLPFEVSKVATNKDEIFLLCTNAQGYRDRVINVYDRNNMAEVKDVILLPRINAKALEACLVSDCLYVLYNNSPGVTVYRITREDNHKVSISLWIEDSELACADLIASANGSLLIASNLHWLRPAKVSIFDAKGELQHKLKFYLESKKDDHFVDCVMQRLNGNVIMVSPNQDQTRKMTEMDSSGKVVRRYQTSLSGTFVVGVPDVYGRILISASPSSFGLFDCEYNPLEVAGPELENEDQFLDRRFLHYCTSKNEIIGIVHDPKLIYGILTGFRLA